MKHPTSSKPRRQRKWLSSAPNHKARKMTSASLADDLRGKYGRRSLPIRKGDDVEIMRGAFKGVKGEVLSVDPKTRRITVEGVNIKKSDGADVPRPLAASNVLITHLNLDDKERGETLERGGK
ncbi:MAG: 50S ribosomal protein L24 [Candidatus Altiarchaeota archaeon]